MNAPIYKENQRGVVVEDQLIFAPAGVVGIELVNCPGAVIRNCTVNGGRSGIQVAQCDGVGILSNTVSGFASGNEEGHGIQLRGCEKAVVQRNTVLRSRLGEDGINLYESSGQVRLNRVHGHGTSPAGNAITLDRGSHDVEVSENRCSKQGKRGIVVAAGHGHVIEKNLVDGASDAAIAVQQCYADQRVGDVTIRDNTFTNLTGRRVWIDRRAKAVTVNQGERT